MIHTDLSEIDISFENRGDYIRWREREVRRFDRAAIQKEAQLCLTSGFTEPLSARIIRPEQIGRGTNLREGLFFEGVNSRMRATLFAIERSNSPRYIYAAESITGIARRLRNKFPYFIGSEYLDSAKRDGSIRHEDLMRLSFDDDSFDLVTTNEVLEHVPDIDAALREVARILKPGGWHIGTCPFTNLETSVLRSKVIDGHIVHLLEPEYHGNPIDGAATSLVYEIPGWNILSRAKVAGFCKAEIRLVASTRYGIIGDDGPISLLCFQK